MMGAAVKKIQAADGTDYIYSKHGRKWRVRVRLNSALATVAPINGNPEVEPSGVGIAVSVALLDGNEVARASDGRFRIFPAHVLTLQAESLGRVDPQAEVEKIIQRQLDEAAAQLAGRDKLGALLKAYQP